MSSRKNKNSSSDNNKPKSLADIGLGEIPLPLALTTSKAERQEMKRVDKKKSAQNTQSALSFLSENKTEVEKHREQLKQQQKQEAMEKALLKRERRDEHKAAQDARDKQRKEEEKKTIQYQQKMQKERVEYELEERERQALQQKMIDLDNEAKAKLAPTAVHVHVHRLPEIEAIRSTLPIRAEEQQIVESILDPANIATLLSSETGSGKTTQVPQFLVECGFGQPEGASVGRSGMICVTQPRRVAAIAMARRVAEELNQPFGTTVCYSVRYSNNMSPDCRLKFVTEGVLLRELQNDLLLSNYSVIVVDEAHERSVSCDVLLGMLSRVVKLRREMSIEKPGKVFPLHLVIMSATLRISDFRDNRILFPRPPPLIQVPVRRFPVHNHFARKTELNKYVDEAYKKVKQIHKKLPPGGILVFLSTQREIETLQKKLNDFYAETRVFLDHFKVRAKRRAEIMEAEKKEQELMALELQQDQEATSTKKNDNTTEKKEGEQEEEKVVDEHGFAMDDYNLDDFRPSNKGKGKGGKRRGRQFNGAGENDNDDSLFDDKSIAKEIDDDLLGEHDSNNNSEDDEEREQEEREEDDDERGDYNTMHILPLFAMLSQEQQQKVFQEPPQNKRLCVISTNIAETSITIPNIRYVVDAGRVRTRRLGPDGVDRYQVEMVSQASAEQRSGRAGRTSVGHCYRLYTPAVYANLMPKHNDPEILRVPLDSVVIMMKSMRIDNVRRFPFPAPPAPAAIEAALTHLQKIGALDQRTYRCTDIGHKIGHYPVAPRLARMLLAVEGGLKSEAATKLQVVTPNSQNIEQQLALLHEAIISIVSVITAGLDPFSTTEFQIGKQWSHAGSDFVTLLVAFTWFSQTNAKFKPAKCIENGLVYKLLNEALLLRKQLDQIFKRRRENPSNTEQESLEDEERSANINNKNKNNNDNNDNNATAIEDLDNEEGSNVIVDGTNNNNKNQNQQQKDQLQLLKHFKLPVEQKLDEQIRRLVCVGLVDQVCRRATPEQCKKFDIKYISTQKCGRTPYWDVFKRRIVFVHARSTVAGVFPAPEYLVYTVASSQDRSSTNAFTQALSNFTDANPAVGEDGEPKKADRIFIRGVTSVVREWLDLAGYRDPEENYSDEDVTDQ